MHRRHTPLPVYAALLAALLTQAPAATLPTHDFRTPVFSLALRDDTQTLASLAPLGERDFDFLPAHLETQRRGNGYVHLGDLDLRVRSVGGEWHDHSSWHARQPVSALNDERAIAAADITATFGAGLPLSVERRWRADGRALVLAFTLTNDSATPVEIGGLGIPMPFDNILNDRSLDAAHQHASFVDPAISGDAGYLQVTRLNGHGPALLVLPMILCILPALFIVLMGQPVTQLMTNLGSMMHH